MFYYIVGCITGAFFALLFKGMRDQKRFYEIEEAAIKMMMANSHGAELIAIDIKSGLQERSGLIRLYYEGQPTETIHRPTKLQMDAARYIQDIFTAYRVGDEKDA